MVNYVAEYRLHSGMSAVKLARLCGCSANTVYSIESGRSIPSVKLALLIARALNVSYVDLFQLEVDD